MNKSIINNHISPAAIEGRHVACEAVHQDTADLNVPCACCTHLLSIFTALTFTNYPGTNSAHDNPTSQPADGLHS